LNLTNAFRGALKPFLDFVFPPTCLACKNLISDTERHVCSSCWDSIPRLNSAHPLFCQTRDLLVETEVITELVSVFLFEKESAMQALAHALKYDGFKSVGFLMGRELGIALVQSGMTAACIIPVPLHRTKLRERGFNQAEEIARGVAEVTGIPVRTDVLRRTRFTQTQTKLDHEQRKKNVDDAFSVSTPSSVLQGKTCILVDDVITTGATIEACAQEMINAGATSVIAASAALAQ
jgi:ComF family protein